ncbi:MAG: o-succinylbenzoate synthase [Prevotella sp.]|nr:o-succinylbenzoate synthase [Bacteroides sp.]MCM1366524.1 o-succinylbenzoate synthase [Prevotella sp.]
MRIAFAPYILKFIKPARTSRGVLYEKPTIFIKIFDEKNPDLYGLGEAAVFPNLSPEANEDLPYKYLELTANIALGKTTDLSRHSSIQFGLEQAIYDYTNKCHSIYFPSPFTQGKGDITINGLIWMGSYDEMMAQIEDKISRGFHCIKLKIGAIEWDKETAILESIRKYYPADQLTIRVDANGAFSPDEALYKLRELSHFNLHSIEQPIAKGQHEALSELCHITPVPIALDEELIGISSTDEKINLLDFIKPQYIILKPALCGGFSGAEEWICLSEQRKIGYWVTSALESNVGLNALAQWTAYNRFIGPQGLGTGALFSNNTPSQLSLEGENLRYDTNSPLCRDFFDNLDWRQ